jgi:hypothetical protein
MIIGYTTLTYTQFSGGIQYVGGTNINITGQTISLTGTVAATNGGTGVNTVTTGDLLYGSATNTWSKLPLGAAYKTLSVNGAGTQVEWNAVALDQSGAVAGALPVTNGGTGITGYAQGEMLYANTTTSLDKVTANTTTTKKFLAQTGNGTAGLAPGWEQPAATDITGLAASATTDTTNANNITSGSLGASRLSGSYTGVTGVGTLTAGTWNATAIAANYGGTGITSYAVGDLLYADTTTTLAKLADVAVGNALISGGVAAAPSWGKIGLATHVDGTLPFANGGTGETSRQNAMDALAGAVTSGQYLRGDGTDVVMSAIQAADVPTLNQNTTGSAATFTSTTQNSQFNSIGVGTAASGTAGEIRATNNITAYFSDDRLKDKLGKIEHALDKLCSLEGFYYEANETAQALGYEAVREVGVSAQQMQKVLPEIVAPAPVDDKYLTVRYERALPLIVEAIKELRAEVEALKKGA